MKELRCTAKSFEIIKLDWNFSINGSICWHQIVFICSCSVHPPKIPRDASYAVDTISLVCVNLGFSDILWARMFCQVVGSAVSSVYFIQVAQKRYILLVTVFQPALFLTAYISMLGSYETMGHILETSEKNLWKISYLNFTLVNYNCYCIIIS